MDFAKRYRQRMFEASKDFVSYFVTQEETLPKLVSAIEEQTATALVEDAVLGVIREAVDILVRAHAQMKDQLAQSSAAVGHLLENKDDLQEFSEELAELVTLSQYTELAAQSSCKFHVEIMTLVENSVYEQAFKDLPPERRLELARIVIGTLEEGA